MVFIGILSLIVVSLIQNVSSAYRRGITLNQINTVGMDLIDDIRSSVQNASSSDVRMLCEIKYGKDTSNTSNYTKCVKDGAKAFVSLTQRQDIKIDNATKKMPVYGVLCTGTYTYIWNSGYHFVDSSNGSVNMNGAAMARLKVNGSWKTDFRLIKVYDNERSVCIKAVDAYSKNNYNTSATISGSGRLTKNFELGGVTDDTGEQVIEPLASNGGRNNLVIYDFYISTPTISAARGNVFYSGSMILGTINGGINIRVAGNSCKPPTSQYGDLEYCAINKFNFAMMAGGE